MRGTLQRASTTPRCRAIAILGACLFVAQAVGLPLLTMPEPASCCCGHRNGAANCQCGVCTHARELASGRPFLKTCAATREEAALVARDPAFPAVTPELPPRPAAPQVEPRPAAPPPDPIAEVPTPPPLARS